MFLGPDLLQIAMFVALSRLAAATAVVPLALGWRGATPSAATLDMRLSSSPTAVMDTGDLEKFSLTSAVLIRLLNLADTAVAFKKFCAWTVVFAGLALSCHFPTAPDDIHDAKRCRQSLPVLLNQESLASS